MWQYFVNHVLNVPLVCDVRLMDIHTTEALLLQPNLVDVEVAVGY
jgi:hypothetical protein